MRIQVCGPCCIPLLGWMVPLLFVGSILCFPIESRIIDILSLEPIGALTRFDPPFPSSFNSFLIPFSSIYVQPYDWYGYGCSTIISPEGQVLATSRTIYGSEVVFADLPVQKKQSQ